MPYHVFLTLYAGTVESQCWHTKRVALDVEDAFIVLLS